MIKTFDDKGTFNALDAAKIWLRKNGYSHGAMSYPHPIGILKGNFEIEKWKNLTMREITDLDGTITGEFREGPVHVEIFEKPL